MSEMKGQVLGIILVITLFGTIAAVMKGAFAVYKSKIEDNVEEATGTQITYNSLDTEFGALQTYLGD